MSDLITVEVTDGIQIITINRPEAKNAINLKRRRPWRRRWISSIAATTCASAS